jgi:hypothetical protein
MKTDPLCQRLMTVPGVGPVMSPGRRASGGRREAAALQFGNELQTQDTRRAPVPDARRARSCSPGIARFCVEFLAAKLRFSNSDARMAT